MTYDYIVNPVNGKKIKINTKQGEAIIEKYRKEYNKKQQGGKPKNPFFPRVPAWQEEGPSSFRFRLLQGPSFVRSRSQLFQIPVF